MKAWERRIGQLLVAFRIDTIRRKIITLTVVATLVPALSTAVLSYVQNRSALTESLEGELRGVGSQAARELDLWLKESASDTRTFIGSFEVSENLMRIPGGGPGAVEAQSRLEDYLSGVQSRFEDYPELLVVDDEGAPVASSRETSLEVDIPADWLTRLRRGETILGDPYWHESLGEMAFEIAQPIVTPDDGYLGALVATLTFGVVQDLLVGLSPGEEGSVSVILNDGRVILGTTPGRRLEAALPEGVLAELAASRSGTVEYVRPDGASVLGTLTDVPRMDWSVVAEIPTAEAFAQVAQLRNSTALLLSGLLVFVGSVAYLLGLVIVRPLGRLATGAGAVAAGDLSVDLPVAGGGEVGYLTEVFNRMVGQLRRSREELAAANATLVERNEELERLSMTDSLTGLYNRRYVAKELDKELHRSERHGRPFAVLMIDVDRFKEYNDEHGHLAGDDVLTAIGRVIQDATRDHDVPGRYGGEEFIVILPDCDLEGALDAAERVRVLLREEAFQGGEVTCSIGAAAFPDHADSSAGMIAAADRALYEAKDGGRDRAVAARGARSPGPEGESAAPASGRAPETSEKATASKKAKASKKPAASRKATASGAATAGKKSTGKKKPDVAESNESLADS